MTEKQACDTIIQVIIDAVKLFSLRDQYLTERLFAKAYQMEREGKLSGFVGFLKRLKADLDDSDDSDDSDDWEEGTGCPVPR